MPGLYAAIPFFECFRLITSSVVNGKQEGNDKNTFTTCDISRA